MYKKNRKDMLKAMEKSNVWGQGQLFAFSALDGDNYETGDFVGTLLGDKVGIEFHSKVKRHLIVTGFAEGDFNFDYVCGDYISLNTAKGKVRIIYCDRHLVAGTLCDGAMPLAFAEGKVSVRTVDGIEIADSGDGQFTALAAKGKQFAFSFAESENDAISLAKKGLETKIDAVAAKREEFYNKNTLDCKYSKLYMKCLSVMKTQLYSPEGRMNGYWSTPDRLPHYDMWLWDSVFHALGHRNVSTDTAKQLILALVPNQYENGMIPHRMGADYRSDISQPPVIAWGSWEIYQSDKDKEFLRTVFDCNRKFLDWCFENRRPNDEPLFVWHVSDDENCRCDESGMDNSPRFDDVVNLQAIDFACFMANDLRYMSLIAKELGEDCKYFDEMFETVKTAVNNKLWDETDGFYYDYDLDRERIHKVKAVSSFLPLFAGICTEERAERLVSKLTDKNEFGTDFAIPSIAVCDDTFGSDMWRGPVWINFNYMISKGLDEYGYTALANTVREKTLAVVNEWYEKTGCVFEFYDCENKKSPPSLRRKGDAVEPYNMKVRCQTIRDYGWSCTLTCDMIASLYGKNSR